jgi:hypothetical protein
MSTNIRANELSMSVEWLPLLLLIRDTSGLNLVRTPIILWFTSIHQQRVSYIIKAGKNNTASILVIENEDDEDSVKRKKKQ